MRRLYYYLTIAFIMVLALITNSAIAQGGGGPIPPHVLPLDGGIGALIAAGIAAGVYFNKKSRINKKNK